MLKVDRRHKFELLVENVRRCDLCRRMQGRPKVLSEKNGNIFPEVVFIGEAPGRLGADRTQIPFHGDQTGKNFERLLYTIGLSRNDIFITNAVLCNPRDENGKNAAPTKEEIFNCSLYLSLVLGLVQPQIIATLGQSALEALNVIESHSIDLQRDVGKPIKWRNYDVLPMYHPGPRALVHRSFARQQEDFLVLTEILGLESRRESVAAKQPYLLEGFEPSLVQKIIFRIVQQLGEVSKFKLMKLLYLLDWQEVETSRAVLTDFYYIAQKDGPLATRLSQALKKMDNYELSLRFYGTIPIYSLGKRFRKNMELPQNVDEKVGRILAQYGNLTDRQIKISAYLTDPMKNVIRCQLRGEDVLNRPIFEGWIPPQTKRSGKRG